MLQPVGVYQGRIPNPHILYGQEDLINAPVTFARIATRWADVQLSNGWMNTNWGKRQSGREAYYLNTVGVPVIPGQSRQSGQNTADFPVKGMAPSQWQSYVASTAGAQDSYPGGPGMSMGRVVNPGSGG